MEKNKKKVIVPKLSLWVRVIVGGYLLYTAYGLVMGLSDKSQKDLIIFGCFAAAFTVIGLILMVNGGLHLYRGEYLGGKADDTEESSEEDTEKKE